MEKCSQWSKATGSLICGRRAWLGVPTTSVPAPSGCIVAPIFPLSPAGSEVPSNRRTASRGKEYGLLDRRRVDHRQQARRKCHPSLQSYFTRKTLGI